MLKRIHIENYKSIIDLDLELGSLSLFLGGNGSGKSSVFNALHAVRMLLVEEAKCEDAFPASTAPGWTDWGINTTTQSITLELLSRFSLYTYTVRIDQNRWKEQSQISSEELRVDGKLLLEFSGEVLRLYARSGELVVEFSATGRRSSVFFSSSLGADERIDPHREFVKLVKALHCLHPNPLSMSGRSERAEETPTRNMSNFASWYRHSAVDLSANSKFMEDAQNVVIGLNGLVHSDMGQGLELLQAWIAVPGRKEFAHLLAFDQLSEGQRMLIGLYAVAHFLARDGATICIDEPDNFVSIEEIQPWLNLMIEKSEDGEAQVILASHHPEIINLLARDTGIVFRRTEAGPTTAAAYVPESGSMLLPAEAAARGSLL